MAGRLWEAGRVESLTVAPAKDHGWQLLTRFHPAPQPYLAHAIHTAMNVIEAILDVLLALDLALLSLRHRLGHCSSLRDLGNFGGIALLGDISVILPERKGGGVKLMCGRASAGPSGT